MPRSRPHKISEGRITGLLSPRSGKVRVSVVKRWGDNDEEEEEEEDVMLSEDEENYDNMDD